MGNTEDMGNHVAHEESRNDRVVDSRWSTIGASIQPKNVKGRSG
jgi:hypothetical protein